MLATKSEIALDARDRLLILAPYPGDLNRDHRSHYLFTRVALGSRVTPAEKAPGDVRRRNRSREAP